MFYGTLARTIPFGRRLRPLICSQGLFVRKSVEKKKVGSTVIVTLGGGKRV